MDDLMISEIIENYLMAIAESLRNPFWYFREFLPVVEAIEFYDQGKGYVHVFVGGQATGMFFRREKSPTWLGLCFVRGRRSNVIVCGSNDKFRKFAIYTWGRGAHGKTK